MYRSIINDTKKPILVYVNEQMMNAEDWHDVASICPLTAECSSIPYPIVCSRLIKHRIKIILSLSFVFDSFLIMKIMANRLHGIDIHMIDVRLIMFIIFILLMSFVA